MGILSKYTENLLKNFVLLKEDDWVKWIAQLNEWRDDCDKFNGCYFVVKQMPMYPQHLRCKCLLLKIAKPIPNLTAIASVDIRKFTDYVFSDNYIDGKKQLFEGWGYTISDSAYLQQMYIEQALKKYCDGEYLFKGTGGYYPRMEIHIEILNKNDEIVKIKTGWAIMPNGEIKLTTPFTGFLE